MFKKFLKFLLKPVLSFFLLMFFVIIFFVIIAAFTMGPRVKKDSILVLDLEGPIFEQGPQNWKEKLILGDVFTTRGIIDSLRKARKDDRIKALVVSSLFTQAGLGKAQDIRAAVKDFAKSKKQVYGFVEDGEALDYYICSAAPKVYAPPDGEGGVNFLGVRSEVPFLKGTLDKLGIIAQMDHIGAYKNASDIFTRDSMSEAHREATTSILDSLYNQLTWDMAQDRKMTPEHFRSLVDQGPPTRSEAKKMALVDDLLYRDQLDEKIKKDLGLKEINRISVKDYQKPTFSESFDEKKTKIGIVYAVGSIAPGESYEGFGEDVIGSTTISEAIRQAREDDKVKAIVLRVDSPGGSAVASDLIWREVFITKKKKPIVVSMADVAASGGYYISMGASKILAESSTITGSIGVFYGKFYMKGLYDKIGLNKEIIKRGEHADLFSDYVPFEEKEWNIIRKHMNFIYDSFTRKAAEGRKKTQKEIDAIGQGRVWSGEQAKKNGLVDQIGGLQDAIREARKMAKIPEKEEVGFTVYPARKSGFSDIISMKGTRWTLPVQMKQLLTWASLAEKENVLLLMPYRFRID